jgi:recombinational DNA repair ATPase RecF
LQAQLSEAVASLETERNAAAELVSVINCLRADAETVAANHAAEIATLTEERDAHLDHTHEQAQRITAIEAELATVKAELDQARQALENPAYVAAASAGGDPISDGGEPAQSQIDFLAEFAAIKDPQERAAFYKANREEIRKAQSL